MAAAEQSDLPVTIIDGLKNARKYVEERGIRIDVKSADDGENVIKLVDIKISHYGERLDHLKTSILICQFSLYKSINKS